MDKDLFQMQMESLSVAVGVKLTEERATEYYKRFKDYDSGKFGSIINWLKDNHDTPFSFPLITDFTKAYKDMFPIDNYMPLDRKHDTSDMNPFIKKLNKVYLIMDEIRKQVVFDLINPFTNKIFGNDWNEYSAQTYPIMQKFYREKVSQGKVYSIINKKWIVMENAITGEYWNPEDFGNW